MYLLLGQSNETHVGGWVTSHAWDRYIQSRIYIYMIKDVSQEGRQCTTPSGSTFAPREELFISIYLRTLPIGGDDVCEAECVEKDETRKETLHSK